MSRLGRHGLHAIARGVLLVGVLSAVLGPALAFAGQQGPISWGPLPSGWEADPSSTTNQEHLTLSARFNADGSVNTPDLANIETLDPPAAAGVRVQVNSSIPPAKTEAEFRKRFDPDEFLADWNPNPPLDSDKYGFIGFNSVRMGSLTVPDKTARSSPSRSAGQRSSTAGTSGTSSRPHARLRLVVKVPTTALTTSTIRCYRTGAG